MRNDIQTMFHILCHPIGGCYDLQHEKKGRWQIAFVGIFLYALTTTIRQQVTGFLFNPLKFQNPNILFSIMEVFIFFTLFCVGNWSVTTLLDGEGRFRDIAMVFGYSCYPIAFIQIPVAFLSNLCSYSAYTYIEIFNVIAFIWFVALLFFGIMTIHQYSLFKMIATIFLTAVAMMVLVFMYLLLFNLISKIIVFIISIYKEVSFRLL